MYNKIKDLTAIIMALVPILFGFGYYCLDNLNYYSLLYPIALTLTCLCTAVLIGFYILWNNKMVYNDPLALIQKYHTEDVSYVNLITASSIASSVNENCDEHNKMAERYQFMIFLVGIGISILLITFWLAIKGGPPPTPTV